MVPVETKLLDASLIVFGDKPTLVFAIPITNLDFITMPVCRAPLIGNLLRVR